MNLRTCCCFLQQSVSAQADWVSALGVVPGSPVLLSGCRGGLLRLWHADSLAPLGEVRGHDSPINGLATNSSQLFTASEWVSFPVTVKWFYQTYWILNWKWDFWWTFPLFHVCFGSDRTVKVWEAKGSLEEGVHWHLPPHYHRTGLYPIRMNHVEQRHHSWLDEVLDGLNKESLNNTDPSLLPHRDQFQGSLIRCDSSQSFKLSVFTDILGQDESQRSLSSLL